MLSCVLVPSVGVLLGILQELGNLTDIELLVVVSQGAVRSNHSAGTCLRVLSLPVVGCRGPIVCCV